jgi:hypothetical protein
MKKRRAPNAQPLCYTSDIGRTSASEPEARYSHGDEMATPSPQPMPAKKKAARIPQKGTRATRALVTRSRGIHFLVLLPLATA